MAGTAEEAETLSLKWTRDRTLWEITGIKENLKQRTEKKAARDAAMAETAGILSSRFRKERLLWKQNPAKSLPICPAIIKDRLC